MCATTTVSSGEFKISGVTCGEYTLVPFYADDTTVFDVLPKEVAITVAAGMRFFFRFNLTFF